MKLSQQPTLRAEDFPDFEDAPRLFTILNPLINNIAQIFDQNIDYATNIKSITRSFSQTGVTLPLKFTWPFPKYTPGSLAVIQAKIDLVPKILVAAWSYNASNYEISITELIQVSVPNNEAIVPTSRYDFIIRVTI